MISPHFISNLREKVAEEIAGEQTRIAGGNAADWPDYRHRTGIIAGLRKLETIIDALIEDKGTL